MKSPGWNKLVAVAVEEVARVLAALPAPLREKAESLPVTYERIPSADMLADGIADDTMGLFIGEAFPDSMLGGDPLPPQILLFVDNLWEESGYDLQRYRAEVRTTFLHELGHYLGLDEGELEVRGLE